jgi:hypothetical protein
MPILVAAGLGAAMLGVLIGYGASGVAVVFFAVLGTLLCTAIGWWMRRPIDASWLPRWVMLGFVAKLAGTVARYYMVTVLYGLGDSFRYYRVGTELAAQWRQGNVPPLTGSGSFGTQVTEAITGGLFAIVTPDLLGGFVVFAMLAYVGQLLLYAAFRRHAGQKQLKPYAFLIFFLPTYAFWPSSIGKDALILLGLGAAAYFASRALEGFEVRWLLGVAIGLAGLGVIRIHIAGLFVAAFALAALLSRVPMRGDPAVLIRRLVVLGGAVAAAALVIGLFPDLFGVDILSSQDRDGFTADVIRRTSEKGTVASGGVVTSPVEVPGALAHVLFRPFPTEASELQHYFATAETTFVLAIFIWKLPAIFRNLRRWRSNPYVVFSTLYTIGFAVAFSVVRNLGIIARQRGQVLAFFLAFVVYLGWERGDEDQSESPELALSGTAPPV